MHTDKNQRTGARSSSGFTLVELLVVIAIIGALAGILVPTVMRAQTRSQKLQCANNLKQVATYAIEYAGTRGNNRFPVAKGTNPPACASFSVIANYVGKDFEPKVFCSPAHSDEPAQIGDDGKWTIDETNNSYAWIKEKVPTDVKLIIASNDAQRYGGGFEGFEDGVTVVWTDGSTGFLANPSQEQTEEEKKYLGSMMFPKHLVDNSGNGPSELPK